MIKDAIVNIPEAARLPLVHAVSRGKGYMEGLSRKIVRRARVNQSVGSENICASVVLSAQT